MAGSGGEEAVVSAHDWVRGITFSILASMIGGASKLSIRKSCEFVLLKKNRKVFACVGFVLLQPSLPLSYLYMYMQCINSYEQYVSIAILLIAISNAYEQYQLQSMRIGLIHHARRRQQHTQNQNQQNRIQGMLFRGLR